MSEIERECRTKFGRREGSTVPGILKFIAKVHETRAVDTSENIKAVAEGMRENPSVSTNYCSQ